MRVSHWLRPFAARLAPNRTRPSPRRRPFCPRVEVLEDRTQPSIVLLSSSGPLISTQNSFSADGRYVAYSIDNSDATRQIYVYDQQTRANELVSIAPDGSPSNVGGSWDASISADGRYVAFTSRASNLVVGGSGGSDRVYVHDRQSGATTLVSITARVF